MAASLELIIQSLRMQKFPLDTEAETQLAVDKYFQSCGVEHVREHVFDRASRIDFFLPEGGVGIEVKLKGGAKNILRQCMRYCEFEELKCLILLTNRSMGFPKEINGKPCYVVKLGRAWL